MSGNLQASYRYAAERYAEMGVDVEAALAALEAAPLSIHCWQGDDVQGFEQGRHALGGGLQVTGGHPGRARTVEELRADLEKALSVIPARQRVNLHAMYGEFGDRAVDRDQMEPDHYRGWVEWARQRGLGLDFNATCFSHPRAESGYTLSHGDEGVRAFWIEHVRRCRAIGAFMGRELGSPCLHNLWIPDGSKHSPTDRFARRSLLEQSLDEIFAVEYDPAEMKDALEGKLFGIGSESFVVGSHDFYLGYVLTRGKAGARSAAPMLCLDMGHFHPTESVADKVSAILQFSEELLLHVSRGVRWDSDHVPILDDDLCEVMTEVVRARALPRVHLALDFFDASMSRVGAWVMGARATLQAVLRALLEPRGLLKAAEARGDNLALVALVEEAKALPWSAVWDWWCVRQGMPARQAWRDEVAKYDREVTGKRR